MPVMIRSFLYAPGSYLDCNLMTEHTAMASSMTPPVWIDRAAIRFLLDHAHGQLTLRPRGSAATPSQSVRYAPDIQGGLLICIPADGLIPLLTTCILRVEARSPADPLAAFQDDAGLTTTDALSWVEAEACPEPIQDQHRLRRLIGDSLIDAHHPLRPFFDQTPGSWVALRLPIEKLRSGLRDPLTGHPQKASA